MTRLYRQVSLDRRAPLPFEALLFLDGPYRLGHGLEPAPGYGLAALVGEAVGSVFDLLQGPVDFPEAALDLLSYGGVHLAGKHILAQVPGIERGVPLGLAEVLFVCGHAIAYAHQFIAQAYQPLPLAFYELLIYIIVVHGYSFQRSSHRPMCDVAYVYPNSPPGTRRNAD